MALWALPEVACVPRVSPWPLGLASPQECPDLSRSWQISASTQGAELYSSIANANPSLLFELSINTSPGSQVDKSDPKAFEKAVDDLHEAVVLELQALYDRYGRVLDCGGACGHICAH